MLINLVFLSTSLVTLFVLPAGFSLWFDLGLYTSLAWFQYCFKSGSATNFVLWLSYGTLSVLYYGFGVSDVLPFTGVVVYTVFALQYAFLLVRNVLKAERGELFKVQQVVNVSYICLSTLSVCLSFLLKPSPAYIYVPLTIFALSTIFRTKFEKAIKYLLARDIESTAAATQPFEYSFGDFKVKEVANSQDLFVFNKILRNVYEEIYLQIKSHGQSNQLIGPKEFSRRISEERLDPKGHTLLLLQNNKSESIGCLKISFSNPLPIERELKIDLAPVSMCYGNSAEIGRFAIFESYRARPLLMETIFRSLAHLCMRREVVFLFAQGMTKTSLLYKKIGFVELPLGEEQQPLIDQEFGLPCSGMYINIANKIGKMLEQRSMAANESGQMSAINRTREIYEKYKSKVAENVGQNSNELEHRQIFSMEYLPETIVKEIVR